MRETCEDTHVRGDALPAVRLGGDSARARADGARPAEDDVRQKVLDEIQGNFPLERDPYGVLAARLEITREQALAAVAEMRADNTIRRIGASFSSRRLGFSSTLCALKAEGDDEEVARIAGLVSAHREVTHNYLRDATFNIWFTLIAPTREAIGRVLADIAAETGCAPVLNLPARKMYKINVDFSGRAPAPVCVGAARPFDASDERDVALVRWAQGDARGSEPFASAGLDEGWALERLREWKADGTIRRFGAFVRHRKIGFAFNGMTVWKVAPADVDRVGQAFAGFPCVSHCYERETAAEWPFNLYAMVHAQTQDELNRHVGEMREASGLDCEVLVSREEFKKTSPVYFD